MNIRENWRIVLLVILVTLSGLALFVPTGGASDANATGGSGAPNAPANTSDEAATQSSLTNLQYGLELSGGTRLRGQPVGLTAEDVSVTRDTVTEIQTTVAEELGINLIDVSVRQTGQNSGTVEVFAQNVTEDEFQTALDAAGLDASDDQIREGVTEETLTSIQNVLQNRINAVGISGGSATTVRSATGQDFMVVEVPNRGIEEVENIITERGSVRVEARFPTDNGTYRNVTVLEQDDFAGISPAEPAGDGNPNPRVPVTLTPSAAEQFAADMQQYGFTNEGISNCRPTAPVNDSGYCLVTIDDGEVIYEAGMSLGLAEDMESGAFVNSQSFILETGSFEEAQAVQISLESGALPTTLDVQSRYFLQPSLAQSFKPLALLTGLAAWIVVSGVVFYRYRETRIAIPMLVTAATEVFILLGFAATVGLALDLSHIAGLIAVIGTGVDDLIIIADEILQEGKVATGRVFQNRFRKAFWVIGAAAATTIIAMSPLAVLSLGDLQGFAIVTIVGVLIGVLITRPAYGDVLRHLLLEEEEN